MAACAPGATLPAATRPPGPTATARATATATATATAPATSDPCVAVRASVAALGRAHAALGAIARARDIGEAHRLAVEAADALRAALPADGDGPPDGPLIEAVARWGPSAAELDAYALGGSASWARPRERYAEWRTVLAEWRPDRNTMPRLASHALRALGWASLVAASSDVAVAREHAGAHGIIHSGGSLDAARALAGRAGCG